MVELDAATRDDAALLANLLQLYQHDMSEYFPADVGNDGRFSYDRLPLYWSDPTNRFPFLINADGHIAGFALAKRGSPAMPDDPDVFDVAEFFVLRRYRRRGIAQEAAHLLWSRHAGRWTVRVLDLNTGALEFWRHAILEYGAKDFQCMRRDDMPGWTIFTFSS